MVSNRAKKKHIRSIAKEENIPYLQALIKKALSPTAPKTTLIVGKAGVGKTISSRLPKVTLIVGQVGTGKTHQIKRLYEESIYPKRLETYIPSSQIPLTQEEDLNHPLIIPREIYVDELFHNINLDPRIRYFISINSSSIATALNRLSVLAGADYEIDAIYTTSRDANNNFDCVKEQMVTFKNVTAFCSARGGSGKTTASLMAASALSRQGKRVLLIDADFRDGQLRYLLKGTDSDHSLLNLDLTNVLDSVTTKTEYGFDVIYAPVKSKDASSINKAMLYAVLSEANQHYDEIIVDMSVNNYSDVSKYLLEATNRLIVLTSLSTTNTFTEWKSLNFNRYTDKAVELHNRVLSDQSTVMESIKKSKPEKSFYYLLLNSKLLNPRNLMKNIESNPHLLEPFGEMFKELL